MHPSRVKVRRVASPNSNASPSPSSAAAPPCLRIRQTLAQWQPSSSARSQRREVPLICLCLSPFEAAVSSTRLLSACTRRSGLRGASEQPTTSLSVPSPETSDPILFTHRSSASRLRSVTFFIEDHTGSQLPGPRNDIIVSELGAAALR